jgi:soluble lytic murein transglycosylase-like protein
MIFLRIVLLVMVVLLVPKELTELPFPATTEQIQEKENPRYNVPLSDEVQEVVQQRCREIGLDEGMVYAIIKTESNFENVVKDDDYGLMQINRINHPTLLKAVGGLDVQDDITNIRMGTHLLGEIKKYWEERGLEGEELNVAILSSYNKGIYGHEEYGVAREYVNRVYRNWGCLDDNKS